MSVYPRLRDVELTKLRAQLALLRGALQQLRDCRDPKCALCARCLAAVDL